MITLSNSRGWMNNTISHSTIRNIVLAAQETAVQEDAGVAQADHSRDMGRCERIFDYVCCGSVKKEYMDYLYQLSHSRVHEGIYLKSRSMSVPRRGFDQCSKHSRNIPDYEWQVAQRMPGNTLTFSTLAVEEDSQRDEYLILRKRSGETPTGIPLTLKTPSGPTLNAFLNSAGPVFNDVGDIRIRHLKHIQQCRKLVFGGQTYQVRFTKNDEPIVLLSGGGQHFEILQRRLHNVWAINTEMQKLAKLRSRPLRDPIIRYSNFFILSHRPDWYEGAVEQWREFLAATRERINIAMERLEVRLNSEKRVIDNALARLERQRHPVPADDEEFQRLKQKITLFGQQQDATNESMKRFEKCLSDLFNALARDECLELLSLFQVRLANFSTEMNQLIASNMGQKEVEQFQRLCKNQTQFFNDIAGRSMSGYIECFLKFADPEQQSYAGICPSFYWRHKGQALGLLNDPNSTTEQAQALAVRLQSESDTLFAVSKRQNEMGLQLQNDLVGSGRGSQELVSRRVHSSSECARCLDTLEKIRDDLLSKKRYFIAAELDEIMIEKNRLFQIVVNERHRGADACFARGGRPIQIPLAGLS